MGVKRGCHHYHHHYSQTQHTHTHTSVHSFDSSSRDGDECRVHWELGVEHDGREPAGFRLLGGAGPFCANPGACRYGPLQGMGVSERGGGRVRRAWSGFADEERSRRFSSRHLFYLCPSLRPFLFVCRVYVFLGSYKSREHCRGPGECIQDKAVVGAALRVWARKRMLCYVVFMSFF